jgi:hypothetical protein
MDERTNPIFWHRGVSVTSLVLGEEYIARSEGPLCAVADADLD